MMLMLPRCSQGFYQGPGDSSIERTARLMPKWYIASSLSDFICQWIRWCRTAVFWWWSLAPTSSATHACTTSRSPELDPEYDITYRSSVNLRLWSILHVLVIYGYLWQPRLVAVTAQDVQPVPCDSACMECWLAELIDQWLHGVRLGGSVLQVLLFPDIHCLPRITHRDQVQEYRSLPELEDLSVMEFPLSRHNEWFDMILLKRVSEWTNRLIMQNCIGWISTMAVLLDLVFWNHIDWEVLNRDAAGVPLHGLPECNSWIKWTSQERIWVLYACMVS